MKSIIIDTAQPVGEHSEAQFKTEAGQRHNQEKPGHLRGTGGGGVSPSRGAALPQTHAVRDFKAQSRKVTLETASQPTDATPEVSTALHPQLFACGRCRLQPGQT